MSNAKLFFSEEQTKAIVQAVVDAEKNTSGEIRVHIEENCKGDVLDRAAQIFQKLGMNKTKLSNGILIFLAVNDQKLAVVGDSGINAVVPADFWDNTKDKMILQFKEKRFTEGLCEAIENVGQQLKTYFPYQADDINELPNEVSFDN